jgi:multidrug efflux pump subunit AcrA (membrane-fusion protein)
VGETVALGTRVARIAGSPDVRIEARVPESDIAKVAIGMKAKVTFDAFTSSEIFEAGVTEIEPSATIVQGVVSYVVRFDLAGGDERLREGMTANVDIVTARRENVLVVPFRALTKEGGKTFAEVRAADGAFRRSEVTTGLEGDDGAVEIRSGLQEGDVVSIIGRQL